MQSTHGAAASAKGGSGASPASATCAHARAGMPPSEGAGALPTAVRSPSPQALRHGRLHERRQRGRLGAHADLDVRVVGVDEDLSGDRALVHGGARDVEHRGGPLLPLGDEVDVVVRQPRLGVVGVQAHGATHGDARPRVADLGPELLELVPAERSTLTEHHRHVKRHVEVEDVERVLDRDLEEQRVRRLRAGGQQARRHRQRRLSR
mmetsp:Transcript_79662/g.223458  ORF Transcript_79662/g.223458 Transcript_79662/m.223458 type:complete len:207 (-) Transcript_79662:585-1205(-)